MFRPGHLHTARFGGVAEGALVRRYLLVGDTLRDAEMKALYEPFILKLNDGSSTSLAQYTQESLAYAARWSMRRYDVLAVAYQGARIEVQMRYTCTNTKGKTAQGYSKATLHISPNGKIEAIGDASSTKSIPPFSSGMRRLSW